MTLHNGFGILLVLWIMDIKNTVYETLHTLQSVVADKAESNNYESCFPYKTNWSYYNS